MKEGNVLKLIHMRASQLGTRLFRINVGRAWTGNQIVKFPKNHPENPGAILIKDPRPFKTGVPAGYHDLSGWTPTVITQSMVGKTVAVFTSIEVKSEKGRVSDEQKNFMEQVIAAGGVSGIARCEDDVDELLGK